MNGFEWVDAKTLGEALAQLGPDAMIKAGGVDVLDLMKERLIGPKRLVNIRTIPGLDRLEDVPGTGLRIGPLVTLAHLAADPAVQKRYRALAQAAGHAATPQIRNMASAAGNLVQRPRCWYFRQEAFHCRKKGGSQCFAQDGENAYHGLFDNTLCAAVHPSALGTALSALGAKLELTSAKAKREVPIDAFFTKVGEGIEKENVLQPGEMITEIRIPAPSDRLSSAYMKQGEKESFDWPLVEVAVAIDRAGDGKVASAAIVLGAVAHTPYRAKSAEEALVGKPLNEETARKAAVASMEGAAPLRDNVYKIKVAQAIVRRTLLAAGEV
jgi:xanthine dehydrogenase YagS FAD-binding subunit